MFENVRYVSMLLGPGGGNQLTVLHRKPPKSEANNVLANIVAMATYVAMDAKPARHMAVIAVKENLDFAVLFHMHRDDANGWHTCDETRELAEIHMKSIDLPRAMEKPGDTTLDFS